MEKTITEELIPCGLMENVGYKMSKNACERKDNGGCR